MRNPGFLRPQEGLFGRFLLWVRWVLGSREHVWARYCRGMCCSRVRCRRCGVTVDSEETELLSWTCGDVEEILLIREVMES